MPTIPFVVAILLVTGCEELGQETSTAPSDTSTLNNQAGAAVISKNFLENAIWRLRGEENTSFEATAHASIYFEHPDTVPYEIIHDTLVLYYDAGSTTRNGINYLTRDSFSISSETGDVMFFDRVVE